MAKYQSPIVEDDVFDPASCLPPVVLSNDNKTLQLASYCSSTVLGLLHAIHVRIDAPDHTAMHIGVTSTSGKSALARSGTSSGVFAWNDSKPNVAKCMSGDYYFGRRWS